MPEKEKNGCSEPGETGPEKTKPVGIFWNLFGRLWALWGLLLFIITMLIVFIPFLLFSYFRRSPKNTIAFVRISRIWMSVFLTLIGCPVRVRGKEKFKKGATYIVCCNHNSLIDVPVTFPWIPGGNKTIAKASFARTPLFGMIYKTGSVLVDRKSETSRRESFAKMIEVLDMGLHMCIYPEGTRNRTGEPLKSFHNGAFRLALATGKEIMPAILFNSRKIMPASKFFFLRPYPLSMHFLDPVAVLPDDTVESLKERVFRIMWDYYLANHP